MDEQLDKTKHIVEKNEQNVQEELVQNDEIVEETSTPTTKRLTVTGVEVYLFEQLTKKNQQYLMAVEKNLLQDNIHRTQLAAVFSEIAATLRQGQKTGQTAKHLYGTPTECADTIRQQHFPTEAEVDNITPSKPWQIGLDGALLLGSVYTFMMGFSLLNQQEGTTLGVGFVTLLVNYLVAGVAMYFISSNIPNPQAPKGKKGYGRYFGVSTLAMMAWVFSVSLAAMLPSWLNPLLPAGVLIVIGSMTILLRFYFKRRYNIRSGIF